MGQAVLPLLPTVSDFDRVLKFLQSQAEFVRAFPAPNATEESGKASVIAELEAQEKRFRTTLTLLLAEKSPSGDGCITEEDCLWVERIAQDERVVRLFPKGCAERFRTARLLLEAMP